ncbi:transmembrane protein 192 [Denticeps clupeoides]|uniref:Transmembrane protein 192 n=1 Tax=Denticeps clupeoides TaxID=299321 RepID=A0AAY4DJR4_9TELE|nr:transmembrane protein 192 [Denticeps clupeoides]
MDYKAASFHNSASVDITQSVEEDPLIDGPLISQDALHPAIHRDFRKLPTHCVAGCLSFLNVVYVCLSLALCVTCELLEGRVEQCEAVLHGLGSLTPVLLGKVGLWVCVCGYECLVQRHHNGARGRGYLQFYRETRAAKRLPLLIHSTGNACVLLLLSLADVLKALQKHLPLYLLLGVLCLELLLSLTSLLIYTVKVMRFNMEKPSPDINQEEQSNSYFSNSSPTHTETGFRDGSSLEEVVEKQADLIEYLKQHNTQLSKRILFLTAHPSRA